MSPGDRNGGTLFTRSLSSVQDVLALRRAAQSVGEVLGMNPQDRVRLATALSELGRDRLGCSGLAITFALPAGDPGVLTATLEWNDGPAPGAESLRLAARLVQVTPPEGSSRRVVVSQPVAHVALSADQYARIRQALPVESGASLIEDLRAQTHDLIATLEETRAQREELRRLNEELEETNRGVMALYAELSRELEETNSGVLALHSELDDRARQLREAGEARTRLWTNVSHELRAPANAVVGLSRLLLSPDSPALRGEQREQISLIAAAGEALLGLVGDLLDIAKAEAGQLETHLAPVDLRGLIDRLRRTMDYTQVAEGVSLVTPAPETLSVVVTDEALLTRILSNLLSNALKFTEKGEVRLDVDCRLDDPQPWVIFTVTDTGVGITQEDIKRVFEEFYQVRGPHQRGRQGTGLGLPYARALAELLGGSLTLTSRPKVGTRAEVRLPGRPASGPVPPDGRSTRTRQGSGVQDEVSSG